jgi:pimeloyl-ACP methyl ester carboxylesterase
MPAHDAEWRELYPFRSCELQLESLRYHYLDEGAGRPLLMVHGNPTWSFYWRNLVAGLRDAYRAVVPDHIGCGLSDKPQAYQYTLEQHTANLVRFVEALDLRGITLLAHDWGGAIGLGAAVQCPERFDRIVLFNTGAFPPPFVPLRILVCRTPLLGMFALRGMNLFARAALRMATSKPDRMTRAVRAGLLAPYDSWQHRVAIDRFVKDIPLTRRHPTWQVLDSLYRQLPVLAERPIQLIWGMQDWCFRPQCLDMLHSVFSGAEVHRFADSGHYVIEDAHERIVPILREFLERTA